MVRILGIAALLFITSAGSALADHSWGGHHWQKTAPSVTISVGDSVSTKWDASLATALTDWNHSSVIELAQVRGSNPRPKNCKAIVGRIEVCSERYGSTGWLGIAQIWISGGHISQAVAKMNDTYFNQAYYNTPAWKQLVMCQEIAHGFGLGHQDEAFDNANLGSCMDYTNDPDGGVGGGSETDQSNVAPNAHDFAQLEAIYNHSESPLGAPTTMRARAESNEHDWGRPVGKDASGKDNRFEREFRDGRKVVTHVFWVEERASTHE